MLRLSVPQPGRYCLLRQQLPMAALLDDDEHQNLVAEAAGGQPVTDLDRGASAGDATVAAVLRRSPPAISAAGEVCPAT